MEGLHEELLELIVNGGVDDEPLGGNARLSVVLNARLHRLRHGLRQRRAGHDDKGIAAAKFKDGALDLASRHGRHRLSGGEAARQRDSHHARIADHFFHRIATDGEVLKATRLESRPEKNFLQREAALRDIRGMLEEPDIACHQHRRGEPDHLPERKIPRHDGEHGTDGFVADMAMAIGIGDRFIGEEAGGVLRVVATGGRAFGGFRTPLHERLPHLERHQVTEPVLLLLKNVGGSLHLFGPTFQSGEAMPLISRGGQRKFAFDFSGGQGGKGADNLAVGGIGGSDGHGVRSTFAGTRSTGCDPFNSLVPK